MREVMRTQLVVLPADATVEDLRHTLVREPPQRGQHLYPVVDGERRVRGVVTRKELRKLTQSRAHGRFARRRGPRTRGGASR